MLEMIGRGVLAVILAFGIYTTQTANADKSNLVTSDFAFGSGTPFYGKTTIAGVNVTLSSTSTEPFGSTSFRDSTTDAMATITFEFSNTISKFSLHVSRVRADEFLTNFNIGDPTAMTGDLIMTTQGVSTLQDGDHNSGVLNWTGLNATQISFSVQTANGAALSLDRFSFDAAP